MILKKLKWVVVLIVLISALPCSIAYAAEKPQKRFEDIPYVRYSLDDTRLILAVDFHSGWGYRMLRFKFPDRVALDISFKAGPPENLNMNGRRTIYEKINIDNNFLINDLSARLDESGMRITLSARMPLEYEPFFDNDENVLYVTIPFEFVHEQLRTISRGLEYREVNMVDKVGVRKLHVMSIDLSNGRYVPAILTAKDFGHDFLSVKSLVENTGAICAVNGGFYSGDGNHQGIIIRDSELLSYPKFNRPVFARTDDGHVHIGNLPFHGVLHGPDGLKFFFDAIDSKPEKNQVVLLTPGHPSRISENLKGSKIVISDYKVEKVTTENVSTKKWKYVLWSPEYRHDFKKLKSGDSVELEFRLGISGINIESALGAGPMLVNGGKIDIGKDNDFRNDIMYGRAPRTGIGLTSDGKLIIIVLEGRNPFVSIGGSLREFAEIFLRYDAVVAMNLDGGGSSAMVVDGEQVSRNIALNRGVTNALAIFDLAKR